MTEIRQVEGFWAAYLASLPEPVRAPAAYEAWSFGDDPAMADDLADLVLRGLKTATASLLWEYQADGDPLPQVGEYSVILDGAGVPVCIIQTTEIEIKPFNQVDAQFAYDEGEGDRSLATWREDHWSFFSRACERIGRELSETMPVVCERFRLVYPQVLPPGEST
jgi:uncharacterized protein YhfF